MFPYFNEIQQIVTPIIIVFIISKLRGVYRFLFQKAPASKQTRPTTWYDRASEAVLLISGFCFIITAFIPKSNFFEMINVPTDSPSFKIRNQFQKYMNLNYPGYIKGTSNDPLVRKLEELCDLLIQNQYRSFYLSFGEALLDCDWCRNELDYQIYSVPRVLFPYLIFLVIVGFCTMNWKRQFLRLWIGMGFTIAFIIEIGILNIDEPSHFLWQNETQYNAVAIYRNIVLGISFILVYFITSSEWSNQELLSAMIIKSNESRARNMASESIRQVTFQDQQLKTRFLQFQELENDNRKQFHSDPTVKVIYINQGS